MTEVDTEVPVDGEAPSIAELISALDHANTNVAEDAQWSLQERGDPAVRPVLDAIAELSEFGRRCALDALMHWHDDDLLGGYESEIAESVIPLLASEDEVARAWSAELLGHAQIHGAIPALRAALARTRAAGIDPAWSEPVRMRSALTRLGDRQGVMPARLRTTARESERMRPHWPAGLLPSLVEALADEEQVLLYFMAWQSREGRFYWRDSPSFEVDLRGPWRQIVIRSRAAALDAVCRWEAPSDTFVTLEWIGEADR